MVFVRVNLIKGRLSSQQKTDLGAALIQAVSDVEGLANNDHHKETSWVQFIEFDPENWYVPVNLTGTNPDSGFSSMSSPRRNCSAPQWRPASCWAKPTRLSDQCWARVHCRPKDRGCTCTSSPSTSGPWTAASPTGKDSAPTCALTAPSRPKRRWPSSTDPAGTPGAGLSTYTDTQPTHGRFHE